MKRAIYLLGLLLLLSLNGCSRNKPEPGSYVIGFYNLENLFDTLHDEGKNDEAFLPDGINEWTEDKYLVKQRNMATVIDAMRDENDAWHAVLGVGEVENLHVLEDLVAQPEIAPAGFRIVHYEGPDRRGIDVALLYRKDRFRVAGVDSLRIPSVTTRDILYVKLAEQTDLLHVFVVHLPSKRGGARASDDRRAAALSVLEHAVDSLLQADSRQRIVVMGDFNDTDCTVQGLSAVPNDTLPYAFPRVPGSLKYHGRWEQIDHFFVSPAVDAVMRIFAAPFLLEPDKTWLGVKPRRTYIGPRYNGGLSDHLPVILQISQ